MARRKVIIKEDSIEYDTFISKSGKNYFIAVPRRLIDDKVLEHGQIVHVVLKPVKVSQ